MSFVSYAQNFEDVILWRALQDVEAGFYVDVGAFDPSIDSVTRAFYERGWRGINIDAADDLIAPFSDARPRDVNLAIAIAAQRGELAFHRVMQTGLSTLDAVAAEKYRAGGWTVESRTVPVETLDAVLDRHAASEIHFLKIDVEGAERDVLRGLDLARWRPWILVIEATAALSERPTFEEWESLVTQRGYVFAYFDGLNRFYVSHERSGLSARLAIPPNVFDKFRLSGDVANEAELTRTREALQSTREALQSTREALQSANESLQSTRDAVQSLMERVVSADESRNAAWADNVRMGSALNYMISRTRILEDRIRVLDVEARDAHIQCDRLEVEADGLRRSASWRMTAPLRALRRFVASD